MNRLFLLLLVLTCLLPAFAAAQDEADYLVLVYLCGTDLESDSGAATADLIEMLDAGLPDDGKVLVLVQTGGTVQWHNDVVDSARAQRFVIADGLYEMDVDLPQLDMGDPDTLSDFIRFGLTAFPARRASLILWDHGGGSSAGVCSDEYTRNLLDMREIHDALDRALAGTGVRFDFIGFDACLMSAFETAGHIRDYADYMIASEEVEPGCGWSYDAWLSALASDASLSGEALGRVIVDSFIEGALKENPDEYVTLSVTDLSRLDALGEALDALGEALGETLNAGDFASVARARSGMRAFGDYMDAGSDMVDILDVASGYADLAPEQADALTRAATSAVVYSRNSASVASACGLSVLLPDKTKSMAGEYMPAYDALNLTPGYTEFLNAYIDLLLGGSYTFSPEPIATVGLNADDEYTLGWLQNLLENQQHTAHASATWLDNLPGADDGPYAESVGWAELAEAFGGSAHTVQLSEQDLTNLSYVEASLLQDASEEVGDAYGDYAYFDYGLMYDVYVDWDSGMVYGLFDGNWPTLNGQMVPMYDQIATESYARSIIPAEVNGEELYLLVVFNENHPDGAVVGYTVGYDEYGNPARGYQALTRGDEIVPLYDLLYWDEDDKLQTERYVGAAIIVGDEPPHFAYEPVEPGDYYYAFCLNDVFGGYQYTDFAEFSYE